MRCFSCDSISLEPVCKECTKDFLTPLMINKEIANLDVVSFFDYYLTVEFIKSKYITSGYRIYKFIAKKYFQPFIKNYIISLDSKKNIYLIGIDESVDRGYSNVALLTHYSAKNSNTKALHNVLKAKSRVKYAGQTLEFRLNNPRGFVYSGPKNIDVILIDDTITTGTTLEEASRVLKESGVNIHFALTVANAQEGVDY